MLRFPFVLLRNLLALVKFLWATFWYKVGYFFRRKKKLYLTLELDGDFEFGPRSGLAGYFQETPSFLELREGFRRAGLSPDVDGVILMTNGLQRGIATTAALTTAVDRARERGLHIVAHSRMPMLSEYVLLTAADDILLSPTARLYTFGPRFDQFFAADALERLGVDVQMVHIGEFKTAAHRFIHAEMTEPQQRMMESIHEGLRELLAGRIAVRRDIAPSVAARVFGQAPVGLTDARRMGLVDHGLFRGRIGQWLRYGDEVAPSAVPSEADRIQQAALEASEDGAEHSPSEADAEAPAAAPAGDVNPLADSDQASEPDDEKADDVIMVDFEDAAAAMRPRLNWKALFGARPHIAVLDLSGMIVMPDMGAPTRGPVIDPDTVLPALRRIRQSGRVAGLLLHINSPGGSALASDIIWEAIQRVRREIPVVAYCTDVAGSGGYYLACAADHIICHRTTLTGSIGVVTGKVSAGGLPERVGLNIESIYEDDADTFTSLLHPLSDEMMERMNDGARSFYRRFLQRVGQSRDLPRRRLHRYARGRIYLGDGAHRRALVDQIGDFDIAFERLCQMADVDRDLAKLDYVEHRERGLRQMLGGGLQALVPDSLMPGNTLPDALLEPMIAAKLLQREPVLALMGSRPRWDHRDLEHSDASPGSIRGHFGK